MAIYTVKAKEKKNANGGGMVVMMRKENKKKKYEKRVCELKFFKVFKLFFCYENNEKII
jgi:hypothetical protein